MTKPFSIDTIHSIKVHIQQHALPKGFLQIIEEFYKPVIDDVAQEVSKRKKSVNRQPYLLAIQGSQGSGKSTLASFIKLILGKQHDLNCTVLSIDDFYLSKQERLDLSQKIHPLLATRGVPGTHDTDLLKNTLKELKNIKAGETKQVVTFNKANDDRSDHSEWQTIEGPQDVIILEGWCVGVSAQDSEQLINPINELEENEDDNGSWRSYVNQQISEKYQPIYNSFHGLAVLAAPSFSCVYHWRLKQEQKLIEKLKSLNEEFSGLMSPEQIKRFISHYQRLTEHGLKVLPEKADWLIQLQDNHTIAKLSRNFHKID